MSSYLTFYLVPKKEFNAEQKPMALMSYSRSSDIYQAFYEEGVAYIDSEKQYTEIDREYIARVIDTAKDDYDKVQSSYAARMDAYKAVKLEGDAFDSYVEDVTSTEEFLKELKETITTLETISSIVEDIYQDITDFEKVLANID